MGLVALVLVASCTTSSGQGDRDAAPTDPTAAVDGGFEDVAESSEVAFAQDLWIYERVAMVDGTGEVVDLTEAIVAGFDGPPDASIELVDGFTFHRYDALDPELIGAGATARTDVEVIAGFAETVDGRALAVLATPAPDTDEPIGFDDQVTVDLTFLGDALAPGDPMLWDYAFLQAYPDDEADVTLTGLDLLAHRIAEGNVRYFGDPEDDEADALVYADEIGLAVAGSTRGGVPAKAQPMMDGFKKGIRACRGGGLTCVAKYFKNMGAGAAKSNELIDCNLGGGPHCTPEPNPFVPAFPTPGSTAEPKRCKYSCPKTRSDPHVTTAAGADYPMQAVGEFVAWRSDGIELQIRTAAVDHSTTASIVTAVAIGVGDQRVVVDGDVVRLEEDVLEPAALREGVAIGDAVLQRQGAGVDLTTADGQVIWITNPWGSSLDLWADLVEGDRGGSRGLLAGGEGEGTVEASDGTIFDLPMAFEDLYGVYAESWRVTDEESLFHYEDGEDTETFTDRDFPEAPLTVASLPAGDRAQAEALCRAAGIADETIFDECTIDYAITGELGVIRSARMADTMAAIDAGRLDPDGSPLGSSDVDLPDPQVGPPTEAEETAAWAQQGVHLRHGDEEVSSFTCPPGGTPFSIWGTDRYSDDSSVCTAGVHMGIITFEDGGEVLIEHRTGDDRYDGTERNGVTAKPWGSWSGTFVFVDAAGRPLVGTRR